MQNKRIKMRPRETTILSPSMAYLACIEACHNTSRQACLARVACLTRVYLAFVILGDVIQSMRNFEYWNGRDTLKIIAKHHENGESCLKVNSPTPILTLDYSPACHWRIFWRSIEAKSHSIHPNVVRLEKLLSLSQQILITRCIGPDLPGRIKDKGFILSALKIIFGRISHIHLIHKVPMSTKVDSPSSVEARQAPISASTTVSSSSLVPYSVVARKIDTASVVKEESTKQVQRKTKWGTDLTQDANVRKGKALAYQSGAVTQQLKSGSLEFEEDQGSESPKLVSNANSDSKARKVQPLELERRELIGEILRLNPSYKAPPDYKPLMKESKVLIPIRTYPGYNFVGLLLGPESNTQKRLEEETGAKVRVYGIKSGFGEKSEITKSDISDAHEAYDDLHVHVSADTYEKVDAAVALIELLLTPVSGNAAVTPKVASEDVQTKNLDSSGIFMMPVNNVIQAVPQSPSLPVQPGQPPFQPYPAPWFPKTAPNVPSNPSSAFMPPLFPNNPTQFPLLRPPPGMPQYFTQAPNILSVPRTSTPTVLRPPLPIQFPPNQSPSGPISQSLTSGPVPTLKPPGQVNPQIGPPIRPPVTSSAWPLAPNPAGPSMNQVAPSNATMRALGVPSTSMSSGPSQFNVSDIARPPAANFTPHSSSLISARPSTSPPIFSPVPSQTGLVPTPGMASSFSGSLASPPPAQRPTSFLQRAPSSLIVRAPIPMPAPSHAQAPIPVQPRLQPPQPLLPLSTSSATIIPTFPPPTNSPIGASPVTTLKPPRPISGDFTFQPLRTQPPPSSPNTPAAHNSALQNSPQAPFAAPKAPSFRPALQSPIPAALPQSSPRLPAAPASFPANASNIRPPSPMLQGYPSPAPVQPLAQAVPVASPRFPSSAQAPNPSGSIPAYPANFHRLPLVSRPAGSFTVPNQPLADKPIGFTPGNVHTSPGGNQIYDPFSPTASAAPPQQGASKKPETDAEYEDLMASVGVK
ncbi:hypothetical protein KFK09_010764 [Dendrobium nobile]|uniref:K Homology domain-containing protein n=1 Tax=Dendrobium nobile TaxID=94219 RepID=A0A8T3BCN3_DENNO|nr:hypothetical protein KFK09_010764 [Dendrobium nobile]